MRGLIFGLLIALMMWIVLLSIGVVLWENFVVDPIVPHLDSSVYLTE